MKKYKVPLKLPKNDNAKPIIAEYSQDGTLRPRGGKYFCPRRFKLRHSHIDTWRGGKRFLRRQERRNLKEIS